ncbi:MAG: chemotaxis protein methyltransferase CheR [Planctomycetota bacterium]|jgi:chemotaxis protein methyltransferase CheR
MKLRDGEMKLMQQMVRQMCGITLDNSKGYLIETRLGAIAQRFGCENFNELYIALRHGGDDALKNEIMDAITTHETTWFRDGGPYDMFERTLLVDVIEARRRLGQTKRLRIWSAACSTGQEPYSIAMILKERLPDIASWNIEILATDISVGTVAKARSGLFSKLDISRTARPNLTKKYIKQERDGFRVTEDLRRMVTFEARNLLMPFTGLGPFDIVFLRNVLIYFDAQTRGDIVERTAKVMHPHGYLIAGGSEYLRDVGGGVAAKMISGIPVYQPYFDLVKK